MGESQQSLYITSIARFTLSHTRRPLVTIMIAAALDQSADQFKERSGVGSLIVDINIYICTFTFQVVPSLRVSVHEYQIVT